MKHECVIDRAPEVRCHECGSTKIHSLCHHCARPMCAEHSPQAFRTAGTQAQGTATGTADTARAVSPEFAWLKQSDSQRTAVYHCPEHVHTAGDGLAVLTVVGAVIAVLGVLILLFAHVRGVVVLLTGAGLVALALVQRARRPLPDPASLPPLPVFPHVTRAEVVERLTGIVSFSSGRYSSTVNGPVAGEITIDMSANDGQKWLPRYRKKHRLSEHDPVRFAAGFAMIRGKAGLRFKPGQNIVVANGTGLCLRGDSAAGHELFEHVPGRRPGEWILSARYEVLTASAPVDIPLWIVPSIVPSSDRRTLEIDLHWNQLGPDGRELNLTRFESIELEVPAAWGAMQSSSPAGPTVDSGRKGIRIIRWAGLPAAGNGSSQQGPEASGGTGSRALKLHFERPVVQVSEPAGNGTWNDTPATETRFRGSLKAIFENAAAGGGPAMGTLSGVHGIDIYLPGGGRTRQQPEVRVRTEVTVSFDISLDVIRYQDDWVVPDDSNAWDAAASQQNGNADANQEHPYRSKDDVFVGVVPDHRTVGELTNTISKKGYYVKSVVEHPPYRDDGRGNVVNRVWDIAGRWYHGVFPIDFDVNLRGEEVGEDGPGGFAGRTVAQVTVKGTYVNDRELTQRAMIEAKWDDLYGVVTGLLRRRAVGGGGTPAIELVSGDSPWYDTVPHATVGGNGAREDRYANVMNAEIVVDAEIVEPEPVFAPRHDAVGERVAELLMQRKAADDAVLTGRISEDTHRGIIARIEAELRELRGQP